MRRLFALILVGLCSGQISPVFGQTEPQPLTPSGWVTADDYPATALRKGAEGIVVMTLSVGPDGRMEDCQISQSSGEASLDEASCRVMRLRARFLPATDATGKPVASQFTRRINWRIPGGSTSVPLPSQPQIYILNVEYDEAGKVTACNAIGEGGAILPDPASPSHPCNHYPTGAAGRIYHGADGKPVRHRVVTKTSIAIEAMP